MLLSIDQSKLSKKVIRIVHALKGIQAGFGRGGFAVLREVAVMA
jgi:hypothetical protein